MEKPKIDIQTSGRLLEIGLNSTYWSSEVDQAMSALIEKNDYYISQTGKVLIFDEETKVSVRPYWIFAQRRRKQVKLQTTVAAAFQLSQLFETAENVRFSEEFLSFGLWFDSSRVLPLGKL